MKKKKTIPIQVLMLLKINKKAENKSVEKTRNGISIFFVKSINLTFTKINVIAKTRQILAMFEPITFPKIISYFWLLIASRLMKSSGAEVAKDTIVKPIINDGTLNFIENLVELLTRKSPPAKSKERPIKNKK